MPSGGLLQGEACHRPKACRRAKASLEAFLRVKPCRRRTLRLGRRPTVQLQSTGTAAFSKHTRLHTYVLIDTAYLSRSFYILLSLYLCVCLCLSRTQTLSQTQKGEETETVKN